MLASGLSGCTKPSESKTEEASSEMSVSKDQLPTSWEMREEAHTFFQTAAVMDPRTLCPTDYVKAFALITPTIDPADLVKSYTQGVVSREVHVDFSAAQDFGKLFTSGLYDGVEHTASILKKADGSNWQFGMLEGVPYMLPSQEWNDFLTANALKAVEAGATGITVEEIGVFGSTGYEEAFRKEWKDFYGTEWPSDLWSNPTHYFMAQHLRNRLCERQLNHIFSAVKDMNPAIKCSMVNHTSVAYYGFANAVGNHDLAALDVVDAIEGQTWSNTIEIPFLYNGKNIARRFVTAFLDYSYWANLAREFPDKPVSVITDPKGDGYEDRTLEELKSSYQHQIVSQLAFPSVYHYNACVWSDRAYSWNNPSLPASTPAFRTIVNTIISAQGQMFQYTEPVVTDNQPIKVGVLQLDTAGYQDGAPQGGVASSDYYSMFAGMMYNGLMVEAIPVGQKESPTPIFDQFDLIVASYDTMKPLNTLCNEKLEDYVENGGILLLYSGTGEYEDLDTDLAWWKAAGFPSPQDELLSRFGITTAGRTKGLRGTMTAVTGTLAESVGDIHTSGSAMTGYDTVEGAVPLYMKGDKTVAFEKEVGKGHFIYMGVESLAFGAAGMGDVQFKLTQEIASRYLSKTIESKNYISYRRGPFMGFNSLSGSNTTETSTYLNLFDEKLSVVENLTVAETESALLLDVSDKLQSTKPTVLFAPGTNPAIAEYANITRIVTNGPANSESVIRIYIPDGYEISSVTAVDPNNRDMLISQEYDSVSKTLLVTYKNHVKQVIVDVEYTK